MVEKGTRQELETLIPPVKEFSFDPEKKLFIITSIGGKVEKTIKEVGNVWEFSISGFDFGIKPKQEKYSLGLSAFGTLIEFPQLREWVAKLSEKERTTISKKVLRTMEQVYRDLNPNPIVKLPKNVRGGMFGFNAILLEDGSFNLSTFGDCACLGKNPYPHFMYCESDRNIPQTSQALEYELHNADWPVQELSLYAGAGTIAWLKNQSTNPNKPKAF